MVDERVSQIDGRNRNAYLAEVSQAVGVRERIFDHIRKAGQLWLFLDYDGTIVPYATTPDQAVPDRALLDLLSKLANAQNMHVVILSGRPLFSLEKFLPIPGLLLAGLYGVEVKTAEGTKISRVDYAQVRKVVDQVKSEWAQLIGGRSGFLLEDKGMAIALHSRLAGRDNARAVAPLAEAIAMRAESERMRILGGEDFIEVAPAGAHKGATVTWLLSKFPHPGALPVYFGDDDKDEEAFQAILAQGGIPIIVGDRQPETKAMARLSSPMVVREWLTAMLQASESISH